MQDKEDEIGFLETEKRVNIGKDLFYFISLGRIPRPSRAD